MTEETPHRPSNVIAIACALLVLLVVLVVQFMMRDRLRAELHESTRELSSAQEKLSTKLDSLTSTVEALSNKAEPDGEALSSLSAKLAEASTTLDVLSTRIDELEKKAAEKKPEPAPVAIVTPAPAQAVQQPTSDSAVLKLAALAGKPYAAELTAWEKLHPNAKDALALRAFAESGIPTETALLRDAREALDAMKAAPAKVDDVSTIGKINTHLAGLVSIKKSSDADAYAAVRRAMEHGDVSALLRDADALDETSRAPLGNWLKTAHARADALAALGTLEP